MESHLYSEALELLSGNPVTVPQIDMFLRGLVPENPNLTNEIQGYVNELREIGILSNNNGRMKLNVSTNPVISDTHRFRLLSNGPSVVAVAGPRTRGGNVNPTTVLPEPGKKKSSQPKRKNSNSRRGSVKRNHETETNVTTLDMAGPNSEEVPQHQEKKRRARSRAPRKTSTTRRRSKPRRGMKRKQEETVKEVNKRPRKRSASRRGRARK